MPDSPIAIKNFYCWIAIKGQEPLRLFHGSHDSGARLPWLPQRDQGRRVLNVHTGPVI